jgi:hypothetical protein
MTTSPTEHDASDSAWVGEGPSVQYTYEEFDLDDVRVAMITDPHDEHAWIQSDLTRPVER